MSRTRVDRNAVTELDMYTENTGELYPQFKTIIAALKAKMHAGTYKKALAYRAWVPWYDRGAKRYAREIDPGPEGAKKFTRAVRVAAAKERADYEHGRITRGEW